LPWTTATQIDGPLLGVQRSRKWILTFLGRVVIVPRLRINEVVQDFA